MPRTRTYLYAYSHLNMTDKHPRRATPTLFTRMVSRQILLRTAFPCLSDMENGYV